MSIEHFADRSSSLAEHLALVCAHHLPRNIETLDRFAGRALAHFSPQTGMFMDYVGKGLMGSISCMVADDTIIPYCLERDIPVLDQRPVPPDVHRSLVIRGPMLAVGCADFERPAFTTGPLSYLGTSAFCALWTAQGAVLHGKAYDLIDPERRPFAEAPTVDGAAVAAT